MCVVACWRIPYYIHYYYDDYYDETICVVVVVVVLLLLFCGFFIVVAVAVVFLGSFFIDVNLLLSEVAPAMHLVSLRMIIIDFDGREK